MTHINIYLTFNGNCREAMQFYKECLGGDLFFQTLGDSPVKEDVPEALKNYILHSSLTKGTMNIMASDMTSGDGFVTGNNMSLMLNCSSEAEARIFYGNLCEGGVATHPLGISFWGALFGTLTDKFGNQWMLHFDETQM